MAIRNIRIEGDPLLRKRSREVEEINDRILEQIEDLKDTMIDANGLGIAAPQVGILRRIFVIDMREGEGPVVYINPEIVEFSEEESIDVEGCLSVPDRSGYVKRPSKVTLSYTDINGKRQEIVAEDYFAKAIQHELDHLDGILYIDKLEDLTEEEIQKLEDERLKKLEEESEEGLEE